MCFSSGSFEVFSFCEIIKTWGFESGVYSNITPCIDSLAPGRPPRHHNNNSETDAESARAEYQWWKPPIMSSQTCGLLHAGERKEKGGGVGEAKTLPREVYRGWAILSALPAPRPVYPASVEWQIILQKVISRHFAVRGWRVDDISCWHQWLSDTDLLVQVLFHSHGQSKKKEREKKGWANEEEGQKWKRSEASGRWTVWSEAS